MPSRKTSLISPAIAKEFLLRLSFKNLGWLLSVSILGCYVLTVESALFIPPSAEVMGFRLYELTDILLPLRVAASAWVLFSALAVTLEMKKGPILRVEVLIQGVLAVVALTSAIALVGTLGGGVYWTIAGRLDLYTQRMPIGLAFVVGILYIIRPWPDVKTTVSAHYFVDTAYKEKVVVDWSRERAYYFDNRVDRAAKKGKLPLFAEPVLNQIEWTHKKRLLLVPRGPTPQELAF